MKEENPIPTGKLFFELIQISLGRRQDFSCPPSSSQWPVLYRLAMKQALAGVLYVGVERALAQHPLSERRPQCRRRRARAAREGEGEEGLDPRAHRRHRRRVHARRQGHRVVRLRLLDLLPARPHVRGRAGVELVRRVAEAVVGDLLLRDDAHHPDHRRHRLDRVVHVGRHPRRAPALQGP